MKKNYIKPEQKEVVISMHLLVDSQTIKFPKKPDSEEDEEVDDFDELL